VFANVELPPKPESQAEWGILPKVIKFLVDRRKQVKDLMKKEKDPYRKETFNIK
jgi:DNA polymerase elongation subunit (family B)